MKYIPSQSGNHRATKREAMQSCRPTPMLRGPTFHTVFYHHPNSSIFFFLNSGSAEGHGICDYPCRAQSLQSWERNEEKLAVDGKPHCLLEIYPKPVIKKESWGQLLLFWDGPHSDSHSSLYFTPLKDRGNIFSGHCILPFHLFHREMDFKIQQDMVGPSS